MSIWFMYDNHTFLRLDDLPVDKAMDKLERAVDYQCGSGMIGCKGEHGNECLHIRPGQPWRFKARKLLKKPSVQDKADAWWQQQLGEMSEKGKG